MKKNSSLFHTIGLLVIGTLLGWQGNVYYQESEAVSGLNNGDDPAQQELDLSEFWSVWSTIEEHYVDISKIDDQNAIYGAIEGLVGALDDPYSVFMDPEQTQAFDSSLNGELEGIGAELTVENGQLVILSPIKNTPAEKAGLQPGDMIYLVNGEPTSEMTMFEAIMKIRGPEGTSVALTIVHKGATEPVEVTIVRQKIEVPSVELTELNRNGETYAHLAIYQFGDHTYQEFEDAVRQVVLDSPDGLILDLRENGGGYLNTSISVLSEFFEDVRTGVIVKKRNNNNEVTKTTGSGRLSEIPMVVLIDNGSASASEILAGALQDYDRATLIGVQSFGKGSVQELMDLPDGSTLRLTIAKWYTPSDHSIDHTGIKPDITVEADENAQFGTDTDKQLNAAMDFLGQK